MGGANTRPENNRFPEFNLMVSLSPELGGDPPTIPEQILYHECMNDDLLREKLLDRSVPTVDTLYRYNCIIFHILISFLFQYFNLRSRFFSLLDGTGRYSPECNIIALVLLNRITNKRKVTLNTRNWRGLWVGVILLAQKMSDDRPLKTSSFARILPAINKIQLRDIERSTLRLLDFNAHVRPLTYARYYFELHSLFTEISAKDPRYQWKLKPMTIAQSMKLELRSLRLSETAAQLYANDGSTVNSGSTTWSRSSVSKSVFSQSSSGSRSSKPCLFSPAHGISVRDELDATRTTNSRFVLS